MLEGRGITKLFGGLLALDRFDFRLGSAEIVGLIGPNGSGKTTLFNVISGYHRPDRGTILFNGIRIDRKKPYHVARMGIGRTFQIVRPLPDLTVLENVTVGILYGRKGGRDMEVARRRALDILEFTGLGPKAEQPAVDLPLADRKRLEVARALAIQPLVLLLDEVFAGLNPAEIDEAIGLVGRIKEEFGTTVFMIEHVMKAIMKTCDRILVIHHGEKIAEGSPDKIANDPRVIDAYLGSTYAQNI